MASFFETVGGQRFIGVMSNYFSRFSKKQHSESYPKDSDVSYEINEMITKGYAVESVTALSSGETLVVYR